MKIVVLNGSPRPKGNTAGLAAAFKEGAESAGHEVEVIGVGMMNIHGCRACDYCHNKGGGKCVQDDDMQKVYPALAAADMIVFASPVHYFGLSGQMQSAIARIYAPFRPAAQKYAMLISSGSPGVTDGIKAQYALMLSLFGGQDMGFYTYNGPNNRTEETFAELRAFGASL